MAENLKGVANSLPLWIIASVILAVVIFQSIIFLRLALKAAPEANMTNYEVKTSIKTGLISSVGPSLAIAFVIISVITLIGSPLTLMRIGIIGSASTEAGAIQVAQEAFGIELSNPDFGVEGFATIVWTLSIGGTGWLIFTLLFNKSLGKIQSKASAKFPKMMGIISSAAMMGAFGFLSSEQMIEGPGFAIAGLIALFVNLALITMSNKINKAWIKQWSLGISMVIGMIGGYLFTFI